VLTSEGKYRLAEAADWLNEGKERGKSELLVAAFAAPGQDGDYAQSVTQKQAEVVMEYLKNAHKVHRVGYAPWSNRPIRAIGVGTMPTPVPGDAKLPAARVELIVFVPQ